MCGFRNHDRVDVLVVTTYKQRMLRTQTMHARTETLQKKGITTTWGMTIASVVKMKVISPRVKGKAGKLKTYGAESFAAGNATAAGG